MQWSEAEVEALERANIRRVNGEHPPVFYRSSSVRLWDTLAEDFDPRVLNLGFGDRPWKPAITFSHAWCRPYTPGPC